MKKNTKTEGQEHPEIKDLNNICDIVPSNKNTKKVCDQVKKSGRQPTGNR